MSIDPASPVPLPGAPATALICPRCKSTNVKALTMEDGTADGYECQDCKHWGTLAWGFAQSGPHPLAPAADNEGKRHHPPNNATSLHLSGPVAAGLGGGAPSSAAQPPTPEEPSARMSEREELAAIIWRGMQDAQTAESLSIGTAFELADKYLSTAQATVSRLEQEHFNSERAQKAIVSLGKANEQLRAALADIAELQAFGHLDVSIRGPSITEQAKRFADTLSDAKNIARAALAAAVPATPE